MSVKSIVTIITVRSRKVNSSRIGYITAPSIAPANPRGINLALTLTRGPELVSLAICCRLRNLRRQQGKDSKLIQSQNNLLCIGNAQTAHFLAGGAFSIDAKSSVGAGILGCFA